jgi:ABC-type antimicrobial peptide transport system permease subunit
MGYARPADALGQLVTYSENPVPVVGIVSDFHTRSLHEPIEPVAIANQLPSFSTFSLKLATAGTGSEKIDGLLTRLEAKWKEFYPEAPFNYYFLDEAVANFYKAEKRTAKLINTATLVAILISCLGLFGLVSFSANQRTKEIGIRKVLGATVGNIVGLLSREFLILVLVAFGIATPLAWWATSHWLQEFSFHIELSWWLFALCGGLALLIAFLTMSVQAIRAALNNPVESLRSE